MTADVKIRQVAAGDTVACARVIYDAFKGIAKKHKFPPDFASVPISAGLAHMFISHPAFYGVVAERSGRVIGVNFLDQRGYIAAIGPIAVDPYSQSKGVGRLLMHAILDRARSSPGVRLVQDAFNTASLSLYASVGFDVLEPLALMGGRLKSPPSVSGTVRLMTNDDLAECAALCNEIHGFDRTAELRDAMAHFRPTVLIRDEKIVAYASAPTFWALNHGVAKTEQDLRDLLLGANAANETKLSLLVPTRQASFFRWCLSEGLRVIKPMTLMAMGEYDPPRGWYYPSVEY